MHPSVYKRPLLWVLILWIIGLFLFYHPAPKPGDVSSFISPQEVVLEGQVENFSVAKQEYHNAIVRVERINGAEASGRVYARVKYTALQWKDRVRLRGKLTAPYNVALLGNFAWGDYLALKGVFAEIRSDCVQITRPAAWPYRGLRLLREDILHSLQTHFPAQLAAVAGGIMLGERGVISPALYTAFQDSGAIHLLVASGGNVGFVTLMCFAFCSLFGIRRKQTVVLALLMAGAYTLAAGADAPLLRAYLMAVCACVGFLLNRNSGVFQGLIAAGLIILIREPGAVFETGFQMSFLATLAIIICLNFWVLPASWPKYARFFAQIFLATLCTQLVLLPVFTNVFYKTSVVGLLSNMILVPLASVIMGAGFLFYVLNLVKLGFLVQWVLGGLLWVFNGLVGFFARLPGASVSCAAWGGGFVAAYYLVLFWVFHWPQKEFAKKILPFCAAGAVLCVAGQLVFQSAGRGWILREWNKTAILMHTPQGETLLFGAGIDAEKLMRAVYKSGSLHIDRVFVVSHSKAEAANAQELAQKMPVGQIVYARPGEVWPGESWPLKDGRISAQWGVHCTQDGTVYSRRGYSGQKMETLSFNLSSRQQEWTVGSGGFCIVSPGGIWQSRRNRTVFFPI